MIGQDTTSAQQKTAESLLPWLLAAVAIIGHLPALGGWWNQDDWNLLAGAQGLRDTGWASSRLLSQVVYWKLLSPLFGLHVQPWVWSRLMLHGLNAVLVFRVARRLGLPLRSAMIGGLFFAASPLAFTPLYWASGVQELLGAVFALSAVLMLLRNTPRSILLAALMTALSILSKESGLLLPLFFGIIVIYSHHRHTALRLVCAALLIAIAIWEVSLLLVDMPLLNIASPLVYITNFTLYAWWMFTPWPTFTMGFSLLSGVVGLVIWCLWIWLAWRDWRRGDRAVTAMLIGALLVIATASAPETRTRPDLAYLAWASGALLIGKLLGNLPAARRLEQATGTILVLAVLATSLSWVSMEYRLRQRDAQGNPADPLVLMTSLSHQAIRSLKAVPLQPDTRIALLQIPAQRSRLSDTLPDNTRLHQALGGRYALALNGLDIDWTKDLFSLPRETLVLADASDYRTGSPLPRHWGQAGQAHIYLSLTLIGEGRYTEARNILVTGLQRDRQTMSFTFDPDQLPVPVEIVRTNAPRFLELIPTASLPQDQRDSLLQICRDIFKVCGIME